MESIVLIVTLTFGIPVAFVVQCWRETRAARTRPERTSWGYKWAAVDACGNGACPFRNGNARYDANGRCAECHLAIRSDPDPNYDFWKEREGFLFAMPGGPLVASLCRNGKHAPAIDLDFPVSGELGREGGRLVLCRPSETGAARRLVTVLAETGIVGRAFADAAVGVPCDADFGGYRETVASLDFLALDVIVPGEVVPSSTRGHFHLYLDVEMEWEAYERVLRAFVEAGFVERGYLEMSVRRKKTLLRRPGVEKNDPAAGALPSWAWRFETPWDI